jgi:hypothetical protein
MVPAEPIPGSGPGGEEPPEPADVPWNEDAWAERVLAEMEADAAAGRIPPEDDVQDAWISLAAVRGPAEADLAGLAKGGPLDAMPPDAELAALTSRACEPGALVGLSDNQVLGLAAAGRRLAARGTWVQQAAIAEFASRRLEPDPKKATPLGFTEFAPDELAPELASTNTVAELVMARAREASRRLPACFALLRDGRIGEYQLLIITEATVDLSDEDAEEADKLIAAAVPGLTPGRLRVMCTRTVMMIDPAAAERRRERAAKEARVERFGEKSGNAALCGRELPTMEVLASSQHIDAAARALRAAGVPGTLAQLRARVFLDLTQGADPLARIAKSHTSTDGTAEQARNDRATPDGQENSREGQPASDGPGTMPVKAEITLLVSAGTLLGWSSAPGEIPGFGLLDPQATRDLVQAASPHPETRWCSTLIGADGTAVAHGCAPGRHPWTPGQTRAGPPAAQVTELLRRLRVRFAPIAKGHCDHRSYSDRYVISRQLKHLMKARTATCIAPCCNRPAARADADHTTPWPDGPSCECNIGPPCRYHHRNKQAPGWQLTQPVPGVMQWCNPSGRTHTTYPTKYVL